MRHLQVIHRKVTKCPHCRNVGRLGGVRGRVLGTDLSLRVTATCPNRRRSIGMGCGGLANVALRLCGIGLPMASTMLRGEAARFRDGCTHLRHRRRFSLGPAASCLGISAALAVRTPRTKVCFLGTIPSKGGNISSKALVGIATLGAVCHPLPSNALRLIIMSTIDKRPISRTRMAVCARGKKNCSPRRACRTSGRNALGLSFLGDGGC